MSRDLFRERSLERLSSPEHLDRMLAVTGTRAWLALAGLALVVLVGGAWTVLGRVPITVSGVGILAPSGGWFPASARAEGRVLELVVERGTRVAAGQTVAVVAQPEVVLRIGQEEDRLELLRARRETQAREAGQRRALQLRQLDVERETAQAEAGTTRAEVAWLEERVRQLEEGARAGIVLAEQLGSMRQELAAGQARLRESQVRLRRIETDRAAIDERIRLELEELDDEIEQVARALDELRLQVRETANVAAPRAGRVVDVLVARGDLVEAGEALLILEPVDEPLEALVFAGADGRRVRAGMRAEVLPDVVPWEEHGYIRGQVLSVSDVPATPDELRRLLANDALANRILQQVGPPYVMVVGLAADSSSASGYLWTMGSGPPFPVSSGMTASGRMVVEERRPIAWVLPFLRRSASG